MSITTAMHANAQGASNYHSGSGVRSRVSIGLPVYNGEHFLEAAIDSLLGQTYADFELIISDNASIDGTEAICQRYAGIDPRVRYLRSDRNRGAAWNHNHVVEVAHAPYFKWAAHDDICASGFLERCVNVLDRRPSVILCYPQTVLIDEAGRSLYACIDRCALESPDPYLRFRHLLQTLSLSNPMYGLIRSSVLRRTRLLGNYPASDIVLLGELALRGELYFIPEPLFFRRDHLARSGRSHPSALAVAGWYDPSKEGTIVVRSWRLFLEHVASVARAPLGPSVRLRCYAYMLRWLRWHLHDVSRELRVAAGAVFRQARGARP